MDVDGGCSSSSTLLSLPRLAPESVADLEEFILKFFRGLLPVTIVCISMLGDGFASLLRQLLPYNPPTQAWIMISRLYLDSIPVVVALAVDSLPAGASEASEAYYWGHSIIDEVAPEFRSILCSNHLTSRQCMTTYDKDKWWEAKGDLDQRLCTLLCNMEEKWFGLWIYLLLADCNPVDSSVSKRLKKGCYVGGIGYDHEQSPTGLRVSSLIPDAVKESEDEGDPVRAKAVILVLDMDIQMLPWENLPNLRKQEIYRMPSVAGISSTYLKCQGKKIGEDFAFSTEIDPRSSYYLVNPCKNLAGFERQMAEWLLDKGLKGEAGVMPTSLQGRSLRGP